MPDTQDYSQLPVPLYEEDPDLPAALGAFRESIRPRIVLFATTEANRNALYPAAVPGTIVSSTISATVWKMTPTGWVTLYSDTGWVSLATASFPGNFTDNGSTYRIVGASVVLHIDAIWGGDDITGGNIGDQKILDLPAAAYPQYFVPGRYNADSGAAGQMAIYSSGGVYVGDIENGSTLAASGRVTGHASYFVKG